MAICRFRSATTTPYLLALALAPTLALQQAPAPTPPGGGAPPPGTGSARELEEFKKNMAEQAALCPVKATPPLKKFGYVAPNTVVSMEATLTNTLSTPVICIQSQPTCTCTTVDMAGKEIPAGGSVKMPLTMKTSGNTGPKEASVHLVFKTAAGERVPGVVEVTLSADVAYSITGSQMNLRANGTQGRDGFINAFDFPQQVKGMVTVAATDGKPFRVLSVMGKPPVFAPTGPTGSSQAGAAPASSHDLLYDLSAYECARMPWWLLVETDRPDAPIVEMRVRHKCTAPNMQFGYAQYYENLGVVPVGEPRDFIIKIDRANGVAVSSVASNDPLVKVDLLGSTLEGEALMVKARATLQPGAEGVHLAELTVKGVGPPPKQPTPFGQPAVGVAPRVSPYFLIFKGAPAAPAAANPAAAPTDATAPTASQ